MGVISGTGSVLRFAGRMAKRGAIVWALGKYAVPFINEHWSGVTGHEMPPAVKLILNSVGFASKEIGGVTQWVFNGANVTAEQLMDAANKLDGLETDQNNNLEPFKPDAEHEKPIQDVLDQGALKPPNAFSLAVQNSIKMSLSGVAPDVLKKFSFELGNDKMDIPKSISDANNEQLTRAFRIAQAAKNSADVLGGDDKLEAKKQALSCIAGAFDDMALSEQAAKNHDYGYSTWLATKAMEDLAEDPKKDLAALMSDPKWLADKKSEYEQWAKENPGGQEPHASSTKSDNVVYFKGQELLNHAFEDGNKLAAFRNSSNERQMVFGANGYGYQVTRDEFGNFSIQKGSLDGESIRIEKGTGSYTLSPNDYNSLIGQLQNTSNPYRSIENWLEGKDQVAASNSPEADKARADALERRYGRRSPTNPYNQGPYESTQASYGAGGDSATVSPIQQEASRMWGELKLDDPNWSPSNPGDGANTSVLLDKGRQIEIYREGPDKFRMVDRKNQSDTNPKQQYVSGEYVQGVMNTLAQASSYADASQIMIEAAQNPDAFSRKAHIGRVQYNQPPQIAGAQRQYDTDIYSHNTMDSSGVGGGHDQTAQFRALQSTNVIDDLNHGRRAGFTLGPSNGHPDGAQVSFSNIGTKDAPRYSMTMIDLATSKSQSRNLAPQEIQDLLVAYAAPNVYEGGTASGGSSAIFSKFGEQASPAISSAAPVPQGQNVSGSGQPNRGQLKSDPPQVATSHTPRSTVNVYASMGGGMGGGG